MLPSRVLLLLVVVTVILMLLTEVGDAQRRRRRRRRRRQREGGLSLRREGRGRGGRAGGGGAGGEGRGVRRIRHAKGRRAEFVRRRLAKANRRRRVEGRVRLVDGRAEWEGNVQIWHAGNWGNICDDEWDEREGEIVCRQLGFPGLDKVTYSGLYGRARDRYWMDNLFCYGTEKNLTECNFDGWGQHDCEGEEAAGLVCQSHFATTQATPTLPPRDQPIITNKTKLAFLLEGKLKLRIVGGRTPEEGRVEVLLPGRRTQDQANSEENKDESEDGSVRKIRSEDAVKAMGEGAENNTIGDVSRGNSTEDEEVEEQWGLVCGDGWSLLEAMVVCRQLGLGFAQTAVSTGFFGGNMSDVVVSGVKCTGNERLLEHCLHDELGKVFCPHQEHDGNIAGVTCVDKMADLVPDHMELARSAHLEDKQLFFLTCAMEENCLASSAKQTMDSGYGWHLDTRRLLRFTARIVNQGDAAFRPFLPKQYWVWHACHMHYHSMEVFAHYDIIDSQGNRVAEGHKASFCLEDNNCLPGVTPFFKCANYGDQGISPGCTDTYAYNIDCQWVDITDLKPGTYTFKVAVNPELKIGERSFDNNAAVCELIYSQTSAWVGNCTLARP